MPVAVELNGLLPGRGPGRGGPGVPAGARPWPPGRGVLGRGAPGRGAPGAWRSGALVLGAGVLAAAAGASGSDWGNGTGGGTGLGASAGRAAAVSAAGLSAGAAGATGSAGVAGAAGLRPFVPTWPSLAPASAVAVAAAGALAAAAGCAAAPPSWDFPARALLGCWAANASLSLRTTGASIVEDADRTNSPISWSLAITALLSTPNSLASSYTRTFATALPLLGPARPDPSASRGSACSVRRQLLLFIATCSSVAHRNLSLLLLSRVATALFCSAPPRPQRADHNPGSSPPCGELPSRICRQDTRRGRQSQVVPAAAAPAQTPGVAALSRSIPG